MGSVGVWTAAADADAVRVLGTRSMEAGLRASTSGASGGRQGNRPEWSCSGRGAHRRSGLEERRRLMAGDAASRQALGCRRGRPWRPTMAAEAWVQPEHGHWQGLLCSLVEERKKTERRKEEVREDDRWDLRPPQQIVQIGMPHRPDMWAPPIGFAVFVSKFDYQCSALQTNLIVDSFLCFDSNVVLICYPSP